MAPHPLELCALLQDRAGCSEAGLTHSSDKHAQLSRAQAMAGHSLGHSRKTCWPQQPENQDLHTSLKKNCIVKLYFYMKFKHKLFPNIPNLQERSEGHIPKL